MRLPRVLFPVVAGLVYQGSQHSSVDPESGCYSSCGGVKAAEYEAGAKSDSHDGDENLDAGHFEFSLFFDSSTDGLGVVCPWTHIRLLVGLVVD